VPTYDYQCRSCGSMTEVIHSMLEEGPSVCERCGGQLRRVLHPTGIIFKGSGFYRTDSRNGAAASSDGGGSAGTKSDSSTGPAKDAGSAKDGGSAKDRGSAKTDTADSR
jgi:putative FmdB family regulatory protein